MSIQDKSILIDLSLASFSTTRTDVRVTGQVLNMTAAKSDSGRWVKKILPKDATSNITRLDSQIRKYHRTNTLPWSDKGARILPAANFDNYMENMRRLRREREDLVDIFEKNFHLYLADARKSLGTQFDAANYPTAGEAAGQFDYALKATPVPHEGDFRCQLSDAAEMSELQDDLKKQVAAAERNAQLDLFHRIIEPLARMVEKLQDPDGKFKDTLVGNIHEITDLIPALNVMDNPRLKQLHDNIKGQLGHYTPDILRDSPTDRKAAAKKAELIMNQAAAWMAPAA